MATNTAFKSYASEHGGRVVVLFLLFLLALYNFYSSGFNAFAIVCMLPLGAIVFVTTFQFRMFLFWVLILINYLIQWKDFPVTGIPLSLPNEMLEMLLLAMAIIDAERAKFDRATNGMLIALIAWSFFCILEVLNNTCGIGVDISAWYTSARALAFQILYCFLVFSIYISNSKILLEATEHRLYSC